MKTIRKRPAVFVDRDNTLIADTGYMRYPDLVRLLDGVAAAITRLREAGYPVVVVTNQSGVARGYFTEEELAIVHKRLQELLRRENADVDAIYYCPFLEGPDAAIEQYRKASDLRKPKPGMLLKAAEEMHLDLARSWMIGDSARDIQAGAAAGCRTILLQTGAKPPDCTYDHRVADLNSAVDIILAANESPLAVATVVEQQKPEPVVEPVAIAAPVVKEETPKKKSHAREEAPSKGVENLPEKSMSVVEEIVVQQPIRETSTVIDAPFVPDTWQPTPPHSEESEQPTTSAAEVETDPALRSLHSIQEVLHGIREDFRALRREQRHSDFSVAQLAGGIAQALALCSVGWGLYAAMNGEPAHAQLRLIAGMAFQLMALTGFMVRFKR